jgi:hypothetical protein
MTAAPLRNPIAPPAGQLRPFTVDEYHRMIQAGILTEDDPVELLEGWIVFKMPRDPRHDATIGLTEEALRSTLPAAWRVRVQSAITTGNSEPEPDLAVVLGPVTRYMAHHPGPADIGILIEVADSSLARDRGEKARAYAGAGIACYWIVNLQANEVEVYTGPSGPADFPAYASRQVYRRGDSIPVTLGGTAAGQLPVQQILG